MRVASGAILATVAVESEAVAVAEVEAGRPCERWPSKIRFQIEAAK